MKANSNYHKFELWVLRHSLWVKVLLPLFMTLGGVFWNYELSSIENDYPTLFKLLKFHIIPFMPWLVVLCTLLFAFILFIEVRYAPILHEVQAKLESSEQKNKILSERIRDLFDGYLYNLAITFEFGKRNKNSERITLFLHDNDQTLIPFSRFSANPKYRKINRVFCSDKEGCIAKAWEHGWHFDANFPNPKDIKSHFQ